MLLPEAMNHVNAILVISVVTWPILSNGHVTLQGSLSSIEVKPEVESLPEARSYVASKTYNSTSRVNDGREPTTKKSAESSPNIILPTTNRAFNNAIDPRKKNGSNVSYDFFVQNCFIQGTQLHCDSDTDSVFKASNLTEGCFESLESSSFSFENFPEDEFKQICNITEAVFNGLEAFSCFGGPMILEGLVSNLENLQVLKASEKVLDILIEAKKNKKSLPILKNLSFKDNNFSNQLKLNQIFSPSEEI